MNKSRLAVPVVVLATVAVFLVFDLDRHLTLAAFVEQRDRVDAYYQSQPLRAALIYCMAYVVLTGLSLPAAGVMTLVGGAVFGLFWGTVLASLGAAGGAAVGFVIARFLLRDFIQRRFGSNLEVLNRGVERDGALYLLTLRLVPVFPFFIINLAMSLTPIRTLTFVSVSLVGMIPGTLVYVNAGTHLAQLDVGGILSPGLVGSFVLLGLFPWIAKRLVRSIKARQALRGWPRPSRFDWDVVVIGGGSAGLVSALVATTARAKVALIEKARMGGDCLNTGCVPSKALIRTAKLLSQIGNAKDYGIKHASAEIDFSEVMERVQRVVRTIEPHDSMERYRSLGVECLAEHARITSPYTVEVADRVLTTRNIVVAAGASPVVPPIPGLDAVGFHTSETIWGLRRQPERLLVLGGGAIGTEISQCFARLGSRVIQVEMLPRLLSREDPEVSALLAERLARDGVEVRAAHRAERFELVDGRKRLVCQQGAQSVEIEFDEVLVAVGRRPRTSGYGLDAIGVTVGKDGAIEVDDHLQTRCPTVHACGDVVGPYQFTHVGAHQAWYACVNALFGSLWRFRVDYRVIPWVTFTDPEVARVGLNELEAAERNIAYEVTRYDLAELDRAIVDEAARGWVKVLTVPGKQRILGATIVGESAGELITEFVTAMRQRTGLNRILGTIHAYPTMSEANRFAAGAWRRAHAPQGLLEWLGRYHRWRRGG